MSENWKLYNDGPNLGLLYYRRIYRQKEITDTLDFNKDKGLLEFDKKNAPFGEFYQTICELNASQYSQIENMAASDKFNLSTTYPGLLSGSGYAHGSNADNDVKIGFFFDHTSGQPVIPGSSVKGLLRSVFELDRDSKNHKVTKTDSLKAIRFFLAEMNEQDDEMNEDLLSKLKDEIFEHNDEIIEQKQDAGKDIFFDAVLNISKTGDKKVLGTDFITPHKHEKIKELDPFVNPIPIPFIKVRPGIVFEFRFKLFDSSVYSKWTAAYKCKLFKQILLTLGIGAKTNVGYGQFTDEFTIVNDKPKNDFPDAAIPYLIKGKEYTGVVTGEINDYYEIVFTANSNKCTFFKRKNEKLILQESEQVKIVCNNDYKPDNPNIAIKKK